MKCVKCQNKKGRGMKIAVFSDVHGNLKALRVVLNQIKEKNVDLTVFLGDIFRIFCFQISMRHILFYNCQI